ncbi:MAG: DoxX family protein [Chitinophagaceae bacterium]|jgi:hypothetical protein|nr:DoxX family protein [Chitinophagaceae bacterium]
MKKQKLIYRISTGLFTLGIAMTIVSSLFPSPEAISFFTAILDLPAHLLIFTAIAKLLGLLAILMPMVHPRLREWAYAGFVFNLIGAIYVILAAGSSPVDTLFPVLLLILLTISYVYHHKLNKARLTLH